MRKDKSHIINTKRLVIDIFLIAIGVLSAGFGLKGFLLPNGFIDGGAVGISLLLTKLTNMSFSILLIAVNLPFILLGIKSISKDFTIKAISAIVALAIATAFIPYPEITTDKLLVSVFGGFFLGMGIGLAIRGGGVLDGTEGVAILISKQTGLTIGDIILIFNIIIFSFAAYILSIEVALYSILTYMSASKTVDYIIDGIEEYTGVTIISEKWDEIRKVIISELQRGVTIYKGEKGFNRSNETTNDIFVIFTVITRLEISKLKTEIERIDDRAFVVMHSINEIKGGIIKKRRLK